MPQDLPWMQMRLHHAIKRAQICTKVGRLALALLYEQQAADLAADIVRLYQHPQEA